MPLHFEAQQLVELLLDETSGMFISAVLTPESQRLLLEHVPPVHEWVKAHHMTISFNPPMSRWLHYYRQAVGKPMVLRVYGQAQDEKAQAVLVEGETENKIPHITISCASGVSPVYSNELLARGHEPLEPFTVEAIIEAEELKPLTPATQR